MEQPYAEQGMEVRNRNRTYSPSVPPIGVSPAVKGLPIVLMTQMATISGPVGDPSDPPDELIRSAYRSA